MTEVDLKLGPLNSHESKAFGEVIIEGNSINLYKDTEVIGVGSSRTLVTNYLLEKNNSKKYILAHPNKNKFKQALRDLLKDREDIVSKINDGTYSEKNIEELVKNYNQSK